MGEFNLMLGKSGSWVESGYMKLYNYGNTSHHLLHWGSVVAREGESRLEVTALSP